MSSSRAVPVPASMRNAPTVALATETVWSTAGQVHVTDGGGRGCGRSPAGSSTLGTTALLAASGPATSADAVRSSSWKALTDHAITSLVETTPGRDRSDHARTRRRRD